MVEIAGGQRRWGEILTLTRGSLFMMPVDERATYSICRLVVLR